MNQCSLQTDRLALRPPTLADAPAIYANYGSNPRVTRYLSWLTHRSFTDAEAFVIEVARQIERQEQLCWCMVVRSNQWLGGMISVRLDANTATLGYCLAERLWGEGYATEAAAAVLPFVWNHPEVESIEAYCQTGHHRSRRVLEKVGLRYVELARAHSVLPALGRHPQDMLRFALSRPRGRHLTLKRNKHKEPQSLAQP